VKFWSEHRVRPLGQSSIQNQDLPHESVVHDGVSLDADFSYQDNRLYFQDKDLGAFIRQNLANHPVIFAKLASELEFYRKKQEQHRQKLLKNNRLSSKTDAQIEHVLALCEAYLARLADLVQNRYASLSTGCEVECDEEGQLILNGIDVKAVLQNYRDTRNPNAHVYLQGLARRLYFVLGQTHKNRLYSRLQDTISDLYQDIICELRAAV